MIDGNGTLRKHVNYDSFGHVKNDEYYDADGDSVTSSHAEAVDQLFYYTGLARDAAAELLFADHRVYNPTIGRWMSEDPSGLVGGDPNLYRYVGNSPLNFTDPTGLVQAGNPLASLPGLGSLATFPTTKTLPPSLVPSVLDTLAPSPSGSSLLDPFANVSTLAPTSTATILSDANQFFADQRLSASIFNPPALQPRLVTLPTAAESFQASLNPHGRPVSIQPIVSPVYGDIPRSAAPALKNFVQTTDSPLAAGVAQFVKPVVGLVGNFLGGLADAIAPPSDPSYLVTYGDGTRTLYMGEGPSSGHLAGQAALLAPPVFRGTSRPTGTLTLRTGPEPPTIAPSTSLSPAVQQGNLFNRLRQSKYEYNEIYVEGPGGRRYILDSYSSKAGEIVSRKGTQFSKVNVKTGVQYVQEAARKYAPGTKIANVPSTASRGFAGQELRGTLYLEVPIQAKPIPQQVLDAAAKNRVIIRDVTGRQY